MCVPLTFCLLPLSLKGYFANANPMPGGDVSGATISAVPGTHGYKSGSWKYPHGPARPELIANLPPDREGGWQNCGAGYGASVFLLSLHGAHTSL